MNGQLKAICPNCGNNRDYQTQCCIYAEHLKNNNEQLLDYVRHTDRCILSFWEAGEPTEDGGYRTKFAGKWYQSRPIDETPKCNCGLAELLQEVEG